MSRSEPTATVTSRKTPETESDMTTAGIFLLPNGTFFVELIVFIVLIFIIEKKVIPPINRAMAERQERIRDSLDAADRARADAAAADDERRAVLEEARQTGPRDRGQANRTAEQVRVDAQARGQAEFERIVGSAEAEVALARRARRRGGGGRVWVRSSWTWSSGSSAREVDAEAHRDLIERGRGRAARRHGRRAAAAGSGARAVNPTLQGYTAALGRGRPAARARRLAADLEVDRAAGPGQSARSTPP